MPALTNAVNLRTKVPRPTYLSVVVFFPSVRPKHLHMAPLSQVLGLSLGLEGPWLLVAVTTSL